MSGRTWLYADPHFFHQGVCKFLRSDGSKLRPWDDATEMSEWMIKEYNGLVHPEDRVYFLGDVAMNRKALDKSLPRLMGRKILVKGNHDIDKLSYYSQFFDDIRAYVVKKGFIMSHIPIHPGSMGRWDINIHGHLHSNSVQEDKRYVCVSVEHTDFKPILLDTVLKKAGLKP
jgi:calcineurin-like phosphoesterase family protein